MKNIFLLSALCLGLCACDTLPNSTSQLQWPEWSKVNPFPKDPVTEVAMNGDETGGNKPQQAMTATVQSLPSHHVPSAPNMTPSPQMDKTAILETEMKEIEMLTGEGPAAMLPTSPQLAKADATVQSGEPEDYLPPVVADNHQTNDTAPAAINTPIAMAEKVEQKKSSLLAQPSPDIMIVAQRKPLNIRPSDIVWAAAPAVAPVAKPAAENFAETQRQLAQSRPKTDRYELQDESVQMAIQLQEMATIGEEETVQSIQAIPSVPTPERIVEPIQVAQTLVTDETPLYTADDLVKKSNAPVPAPSVVTNAAPVVQTTRPIMQTVHMAQMKQNAPMEMVQTNPEPTETTAKVQSVKGCPKINILPEARSLTYFDENMSGEMVARASISDVRGGCEAVSGGMEIDLDILMDGHISDAGRFEGDKNQEAFITFPYFVSVTSPQGQVVDKKIMATAMRFQPVIDALDHAEKITQYVPMADVSRADAYTLTIGYQLTRKQMEYNRAQSVLRTDNVRATPDVEPARKRSYNPLAGENY